MSIDQSSEIKILDHIQECSGLVVYAEWKGKTEWIRASELPLTRDEIEQEISNQCK